MAEASPTMIAGADVGGTFTDVVVVDEQGVPRAVKVPTTPADQSEGLVAGMALVTDALDDVAAVAHGTTTATNAVLERKVARTVLVTTQGFRDLLTIGRQDRPSLYDLAVVRPEPLVPGDRVVTVHERIAADGTQVIPLEDAEVARVVDEVRLLQAESVAICLLFSFVNPAHEQRLAAALHDELNVPVTLSSVLLPEFREYERASTCVLDAAVTPVMRRYLGRVSQRLPAADISVMTSAGGVADVEAVAAAPVHTLLSGPAGGVVAAAAVAGQTGFPDALAFDMGGTSTDVCLIRDGVPDVATEARIGGLPFATPAVAVHTVGAGGGSIAAVDVGGALRVGPESAGAEPGPACYGRGGQAPTVTDAHAVLGHLLDAQQLGDSGMRLDTAAARHALSQLPGFASPDDAAQGVLTVVRAAMLRALRRVSTEQGVDPSSLALVAYGGAGPLHATALARELGCAAALIPQAPGVLSALGLLLAPPRVEVSRTVMAAWPRDDAPPDLRPVWDDLQSSRGDRPSGASVRRVADCRYAGQSHELRLDVPADGDLAAALDLAHERAYGYGMPDEPLEVVTVRLVAEGPPALEGLPGRWDHGTAAFTGRSEIVAAGQLETVVVHHRGDLAEGDEVVGPCLIVQPDSTTLVDRGETARVLSGGTLRVTW